MIEEEEMAPPERPRRNFNHPNTMTQIATAQVRRQLKKVLDRSNRREKAERVGKTLEAIRHRRATPVQGEPSQAGTGPGCVTE